MIDSIELIRRNDRVSVRHGVVTRAFRLPIIDGLGCCLPAVYLKIVVDYPSYFWLDTKKRERRVKKTSIILHNL
jgi:hypothetical protein